MQSACRTHLAGGYILLRAKRVTKQRPIGPTRSKRCNRLAAHTWPAAIFLLRAKRVTKQSQLAPRDQRDAIGLPYTLGRRLYFITSEASNKAKPIGPTGSKRCNRLAVHTWSVAIFYQANSGGDLQSCTRLTKETRGSAQIFFPLIPRFPAPESVRVIVWY